MTTWEYANIRTLWSWDKRTEKFSKWQVYYTGCKAHVSVTEGLKKMGAMDWELVTTLPGASSPPRPAGTGHSGRGQDA